MAVMVNDERIEQAEIDGEIERLRPHYQQYVQEADGDDEAGPEQLAQWARENIIERVVLLQAARSLPGEIPASEIDAAYREFLDRGGQGPVEAVKAEIEARIRIERLMEANVPPPPEPTEAQIAEFYDTHADQLTMPEQVRASHIVKHVGAQADRKRVYEAILDVRMRLAAGEEFDSLARSESDCPENAGYLGQFGRGEMVAEFENVVFSMQPGGISDVFQTDFGYHIVRLHEHLPARRAPLAEVRGDIARELTHRAQQEAGEAFIDSLVAKAAIENVADD